MKRFYIYILCNKRNGTLYTGITSDLILIKRIYEHKNNLVEGFTQKYNIHRLVWYEMHETAETAISREKQIKAWKRQWKLRLIEENNPEWNNLYDIICEDTGFLPPQEWHIKRNHLPNNVCTNAFPCAQKWFLCNTKRMSMFLQHLGK